MQSLYNAINGIDFSGVRQSIESNANQIGGIFKNIGSEISKRTDGLRQYLPSFTTETPVAPKQKSVGETIVENLVPTVQKGIEVAKSLGVAAYEVAKPVAAKAFEAVHPALSTAAEAAKSFGGAALDAAKPVASAALDTVKPLAEKVAEVAAPTVKKVTDTVKSTFADAIVSLIPFEEIFSSLKTKVLDSAKDATSIFTSIFEKAKDFFSTIFKLIADFFKGLIKPQ
jgi:phage-related protein